MRRRLRREVAGPQAGYATVWASALMLVCVAVGQVALVGAGVVAAQHQLDTAGELAALAAAQSRERGGDACRAAAAAADDNHVALAACRLVGGDVVVTVSRRVAVPIAGSRRLTASSRAGPT